MSTDVNTAESNNGGTDKDEDENDKNSNHYSDDFSKYSNFVALPIDVLGSWHFSAFNFQRLSFIQVFILDLIDTTATDFSEAAVQARIKQIVVVVISKTLDF